jgi:pimeloyl-ACP methyl ester carboxylesterase
VAARYALQAVKGAGHWLHAEKPTETVHAVATFVRAVEALPAGG